MEKERQKEALGSRSSHVQMSEVTVESSHRVCAQPYLTLCKPTDCNLPGSSIRGIFQTRILEWVAISYSRAFSLLRDQTSVSCGSLAGSISTT